MAVVAVVAVEGIRREVDIAGVLGVGRRMDVEGVGWVGLWTRSRLGRSATCGCGVHRHLHLMRRLALRQLGLGAAAVVVAVHLSEVGGGEQRSISRVEQSGLYTSVLTKHAFRCEGGWTHSRRQPYTPRRSRYHNYHPSLLSCASSHTPAPASLPSP